MRFSLILALLPLALANPIPDNRSSRQANKIKDNANKGADVANKEIDAIQGAQSAIKNNQSPKPAETELQRQLKKGVDIRKQNQRLVGKLPKRDDGDDGDDSDDGPTELIEVRPSKPANVKDDEPQEPEEPAILETRASKKEATKTLNGIEEKQKAAQKKVNGFKGNGQDSAALESLRKSFQGGNAKLSQLTGQIPGRK